MPLFCRDHFCVTKRQRDELLGAPLAVSSGWTRDEVIGSSYVRLMISENQYPVTCVERPPTSRSDEVKIEINDLDDFRAIC
jgi:hypothetical protein